MTDTRYDMSPRKSALTAAFALLGITAIVPFVLVYSLPTLMVDNDTAATIRNLIAEATLFRVTVFFLYVVIFLDIIVTWALYQFFVPANSGLSLLTAWFRLVYVVLFGAALASYVGLFRLAGVPEGVAALTESQVAAALAAFTDGWNMAYIFFGVHLSFLGYLAYRSGYVPRWVGALVLVGGLSYVIDYCLMILVEGYGITVSLLFGWTELILAVWLLIKGGKDSPRGEAQPEHSQGGPA